LTDEQAADAVQEALTRMWRELRGGAAIERPDAWAFRTVYRLAMDAHRWRRRLDRFADLDSRWHSRAVRVREHSDRPTRWHMDGQP